jgi:hypothetical protein
MATNSWLTTAEIFRPIRKRTKAAYARLFEQTNYLFGRGTRTTVFPNGQREIWISNADGTAHFSITAGDGPAGFSVSIKAAVGTLPAEAHVMTRPDYITKITEDVREITFIAHYQDAYSQQFRKWYACDDRDEQHIKTVPHPDVLGLEPRTLTPESVDRPLGAE